MGACFSRKKHSSSSSSLDNVSHSAAVVPSKLIDSLKADLPEKNLEAELELDDEKVKKQVAAEESLVKKEIFVIKHRKSHDRERPSVSKEEENKVSAVANGENGSSSSIIRTSSCTKEEVDAILIQCGRLSRSNSSGTAAKTPSSGRKYAGSKRSFDLDNEQDYNPISGDKKGGDEEEEHEIGGDGRQHRQRQRQRQSGSRQTHSSPRRRTPSREREKEQRSGSRERGNGSSSSSGRRVSRSPGKRSETNPNSNGNNSTSAIRPGKKMVSVPATVSSFANSGVESQTATGVKRISVKRNVGEAAGLRTAASPRSQSPARPKSPAKSNARAASIDNNQQQQPSLSRSNSRKAEQSPYRRNPLSEIDPNSLVYAQTNGNNKASKVVDQIQKPQTPSRSRSGRRSRDFDFNSDNLMNTNNPNPSYTALLLEDIQNFHQKNTTNGNGPSPSFLQVPACLSKACSILEAVADLNSTTSSNTFVEGKKKKVADVKDPFLESEVVVSDDLMEPSLHKYVTVRRGGNGGEDMDGQESSGSNSFVGGGGQQNRAYSTTSSWEPNSADSTDRWSSDEKRSLSPLGFSGIERRVTAAPSSIQ